MAKKAKIGDWTTSVTIGLTLRKGGTRLYVGITPVDDKWIVVALTTPAKGATVNSVLDQHSHKALGEELEFLDRGGQARRGLCAHVAP